MPGFSFTEVIRSAEKAAKEAAKEAAAGRSRGGAGGSAGEALSPGAEGAGSNDIRAGSAEDAPNFVGRLDFTPISEFRLASGSNVPLSERDLYDP